ncbi:B12-binding domain-containing protein [Desulfogranum japonicum]|uniref:B12-binding domain-containing protein n=1 Tax=Desulfogranum japonicum TaxID=231447 RepID=UPI000408DA75|nr:B12-binding domain-containing protein [Desulfogranum japonicum]
MKYLEDNSLIFSRYDLFREQKEERTHRFSHDALLQEVAEHVIHGDDEKIITIVDQALEYKRPEEVIREGLIPGMDEVSRLWGEGIYFLPQVVLSADAMLEGITRCEEKMGRPMEKKGKVITHTAEGDIHDIGQLIVNALLRAAGYEVINLGVDVPVDLVVRSCQQHRPILLGGTALMTTTMTAFPRIAARLKHLNLQIPFVCGGGAVNEDFTAGFDLGIWGKEASWAVGIAEDALQGMTWSQIREKWNG